MACFQPLLAVDFGIDSESNKHRIKILPRRADFNLNLAREKYGSNLMMLPCGHCIACAQDYARTWQARIMCESLYFDKKSFITLTYSDAPESPSKDDLRRFIKAVRNKYGKGIKFFACGEKGTESKRSHYHLILFGVDFAEDRYEIAKRGLNLVYRSPSLEKLWPYGFSSIGSLDISSAGYVSKYCDKKKISRIDEGEFVMMSRGLGRRYFADHHDEIFNSDFLYFDGNKFKIPRYFLLLASNYDFYTAVMADDLRDRKRNVALNFRYDKNRSVSYEEEGMIASENVALSKYENKEAVRDVY